MNEILIITVDFNLGNGARVKKCAITCTKMSRNE